jgi:hypothetical protein
MDSRGIGNYIEILEAGGAIFATTAASTISVTGQTIDRSDYLSGAFFAGFFASANALSTVEITGALKELKDGAWATVEGALVSEAISLVTGANYGGVELNVDLSGCEKEVRLEIAVAHPAVSQLGYVNIVAVLGGATVLPV